MAGKTNLTFTNFSAKKLLYKAHTSLAASDQQEIIGSAIQLSSQTIFGDAVPSSPALNLNQVQDSVEYVEFDLTPVAASFFDANSFDSDASAQPAGHHAYFFSLKSSYQTDTNNPNAGNGVFTNGRHLTGTLGGLQIVPPSFSTDAPNPYNCKIFSGSRDVQDEIPLTDEIDWYVDYYNGILYVQDVNSDKVPTRAKAFIYTGDMLSSKAGGGGSGTGVGWLASGNGGISTTGSLFIGTNTAIAGNSDIYFSNTGEAFFNQQGLNSDFNIKSVNKDSIFKVDADQDKIMFLSGGAGSSTDEANGADISFYVSGSKGSLDSNSGGGSLFGGDVAISGSLKALDTISGSITHTKDGKSYLVAGANISIVSASNGQITISSAGGSGSPAGANTQIQFNNAGSFGASSAFTFTGTEVELNASSPKYTLRRSDNSEESSLTFEGSIGVPGASVAHGANGNDLVFKTFGNGGASLEEMLRLGGYNSGDNRRVIFLSGSGVAANDMQPHQSTDIAFFVSGAIGSRDSSTPGTSVFGGDLVVSGNFDIFNTGSAGEFGIGTNSPGTMLQVEGTKPYLTLKNTTAENTDGGAESKIIFEDHTNAALAQIQASHDGTGDDTKGDLIFSVNDGSSLSEAVKIGSDKKLRAHRFGPGSAFGNFGFPQYQIAELSDVLFRADARFQSFNSKSSLQTFAAATTAGEVTAWRAQIKFNGGNNVEEPSGQQALIDTTGMTTAVNRRRSPTFSGTFTSTNVDDYVEVVIDSLASGRRAVSRELLDFSGAADGNSVTFNVPIAQGGSGTFTIEYSDNPSAADSKIIIDFDHTDNANSNAENLAQLTSFVLNGTDPNGQARASGGGNYDANWGIYASSGVGTASNFTSGLDAVIASTASKLDIFASSKGADSSIANNIQITNTSGTIRAGSDDTPLQKGSAANGHEVDTFKWRLSTSDSYTEGVQITGGSQALVSGVTVTFDRTTGFSLGTGTGGSVADSWRWSKIRSDLPESLFNSDYDTRIELQNGETHKFVIDITGVRPYGLSPKNSQRYGIVYPQGELITTFYFNHQNFSSNSYRAYYTAAFPTTEASHAGWKTTSDTAFLKPAVNISNEITNLVQSVEIGSQNYLGAFEITIVANAETGAGTGSIQESERTSIVQINYITDRPSPSVVEPVAVLKSRSHQNVWGSIEYPSGSESLPSISFRDGTKGSTAEANQSDTGFFMPATEKVSVSTGGSKVATFFSGGLEINPAGGVFLHHGNDSQKGSLQSYDSNGSLILSSSNGDLKFDSGAGVWHFEEDGNEQLKIETSPDSNDIKFVKTNEGGQFYFNLQSGGSEVSGLQILTDGTRGKVGINFQSSGPTNLLDIKADSNDQGFTVRNASNKPVVQFSLENVNYGRLIFQDETSVGITQIGSRPGMDHYFHTSGSSKFGIGTRFPGHLLDVRSDSTSKQVFLLSGSGAGLSPDESTYRDINFFVSGSKNSRNTNDKGSALFGGDTIVSGSIVAKSGAEIESTLVVTGAILPGGDKVYDLGAPNNRFANIYTGDLHLRNERGNWTIVEEAEYLTVVNNLTGKKYKMVLEPLE